jgi:hypothetical protein
MEGPTGKFIAAHLRLTHGVKEELHIPGSSGKRGKQIVRNHRGCGCWQRRRGGATRWRGAKILEGSFVANIQDHAPNEVGGKSSEKKYNQDGEALPQR